MNNGAAAALTTTTPNASTSGTSTQTGAVTTAASTGGSWSSIGPSPIPNGQTTTVSTAVSGRVSAIAVHPTNPNVVYVGTAQGGVYRTLDGGSTWTALMDNAKSLAIGAIAIAPSQPTTIFVGTGEGNFSCDAFFGVGLYRIDNAETTADLSALLNLDQNGTDVFSGRSIGKILVDPNNANTIFASSTSGIGGIGCDASTAQPDRGLYRSTNALSADPRFTKLTVATANLGNRSITDMVFEPGNANTMLCTVYGLNGASDGGIWRTTNALAATPTFTQTLVLGSTTAAVRAQLAINKIGTTVTVYAATGETTPAINLGQNGRLRKSTDGGQTWSSPLTAADGYCGGQCGYDIAIALHPSDANTLYLGGSANSTYSDVLTKSTNGGSTMTRIDTGLHGDTHALTLAPSNPSLVFFGSDGGVWKSTNAGTNWTSLNTAGFVATQFQSVALHPIDPNYTIGGSQDNGTERQRPDGTWTRTDYGDGGFALIDQNATDTTTVRQYHTYYNQVGTNGTVGFATTTNSAAFENWTFLGCGGTANGINCNDSAVEFYAPMTLGPGNPNTLYFGTDRLYRSTNSGTNMSVVSQQFVSGIPVSAIGVSAQNDAVRIVGLDNGKVFATTNGSTTMTDVTGAIPAKYVARTVIDPNNANTAYVTLAGFGLAAGQHIWKTTNLSGGGSTWAIAGNGIPDVPVNAFAVDPANSQNLYAGTDIGVYGSTDGGATWNPTGTGLPIVAVFDMAIHKGSRILRIATHGRGMWDLSLGTTSVTPPADPTALSATAASASGVNLTWTDNATNEDGFKIERSIDNVTFTQIATTSANATSYSNTGLAASTTYYYRVNAYNTGGDSGYSNVAQTTTQSAPTPPTAPGSLSATATSASQINLSWADNSSDEDGFKIERSADGITFTQITSVGAGATSYSNTGLAASTTYSYRVRAYNAGGDSAYSNTAQATTQATPPPATPAAPSNLTATAASKPGQIALRWTDNSTNETGFKIERCTNANCTNFAALTTVGAGVTSYTDSGLARGTTYGYRVYAYNGSGNSAFSNASYATTK